MNSRKLTLSQWIAKNRKKLRLSYRAARRQHQLNNQAFNDWCRELYCAYVEYGDA
jgi:hypothetical protein